MKKEDFKDGTRGKKLFDRVFQYICIEGVRVCDPCDKKPEVYQLSIDDSVIKAESYDQGYTERLILLTDDIQVAEINNDWKKGIEINGVVDALISLLPEELFQL